MIVVVKVVVFLLELFNFFIFLVLVIMDIILIVGEDEGDEKVIVKFEELDEDVLLLVIVGFLDMSGLCEMFEEVLCVLFKECELIVECMVKVDVYEVEVILVCEKLDIEKVVLVELKGLIEILLVKIEV